MPEEEPWWIKHITFKWSDPIIEEVLSPEFSAEAGSGLSIGEIKELAQDFNNLRRKFRNLVGMLEINDSIMDDYLDKINNYSDERLLSWRKKRNDKIAADRKAVEDALNYEEEEDEDA